MGSVPTKGIETPTKTPSQEPGFVSCPNCGTINKKFYWYCRECIKSLRATSQTQYIHVAKIK
ncbi:DUF7577 domain-containing protein [Halococcus salsus]|uniref:DUF7577 domain-containing protein n=1 Tax=Halococcus salsus TaxID=2162894 RepID=UPI003B82F9F7